MSENASSPTPRRPSLRYFRIAQPIYRHFQWRDAVVLVGLAVLIYLGARLAFAAPQVVDGPTISLAPRHLPRYALYSVARMAAAYLLSIVFTLLYGQWAASSPRAETILMPLLDVLQSVPILSFLPLVLLSLSAILPLKIAVELASIVLIFTSQAWNMTFGWYQSLVTTPKELREASAIFRFSSWQHFKTLSLPFAAVSLIWNSMMSWAGGWFFLMAAEIFTVGQRDFRLPGLGAFLGEAANQGDLQAILWGLFALVLVIVALDQLLWRPLLAWSNRFKLEMVEDDEPPTSWFYDWLRSSSIHRRVSSVLWRPILGAVDACFARLLPLRDREPHAASSKPWFERGLYALGALGLAYGAYQAASMLVSVPLIEWARLAGALAMTLLRVVAALTLALAWTIPVGVAIGTNRRVAAVLQPVAQVAASLPATALFPVLLIVLIRLPGGLSLGAVILMLMGTQWYLLFNTIAGAAAIPQDLKFTAQLMRLTRWQRWRTLILPALFPYVVTGAITASGGAWNASIVAEYAEFGGKTLMTTGLGATIAHATASGDYPLLLAATLTMILAVTLINRLFWRRLYRLAEERYRME
jgi:NitT/TauT family transport system permease protein